MRKLTITLNEAFKSFPHNFSQEIDGDLVILSGVNGSGKTQLFDIIRGFKNNDQNQPMARGIALDGNMLSMEV